MIGTRPDHDIKNAGFDHPVQVAVQHVPRAAQRYPSADGLLCGFSWYGINKALEVITLRTAPAPAKLLECPSADGRRCRLGMANAVRGRVFARIGAPEREGGSGGFTPPFQGGHRPPGGEVNSPLRFAAGAVRERVSPPPSHGRWPTRCRQESPPATPEREGGSCATAVQGGSEPLASRPRRRAVA